MRDVSVVFMGSTDPGEYNYLKRSTEVFVDFLNVAGAPEEVGGD